LRHNKVGLHPRRRARMLVRLPEPVTTKAALRRPWQMLMRRRGMVAIGLFCVPFHAAAMLAGDVDTLRGISWRTWWKRPAASTLRSV
jgi:hypothetical protein